MCDYIDYDTDHPDINFDLAEKIKVAAANLMNSINRRKEDFLKSAFAECGIPPVFPPIDFHSFELERYSAYYNGDRGIGKFDDFRQQQFEIYYCKDKNNKLVFIGCFEF